MGNSILKYKFIKSVVDELTGRDLSEKTKKNRLDELRFIYYQLCYDFDKLGWNLTDCAKVVNQKHTSSSYGVKKFDDYRDQPFFSDMMVLYHECTKKLEQKLKTNSLALFKEIDTLKKRVDAIYEMMLKDINVEHELVSGLETE